MSGRVGDGAPKWSRAQVLGMARCVVSAVGARPWMWPVALLEMGRMARSGWWHNAPFLPVPDSSLWSFRMETAYGADGERIPTSEEMRAFLAWCRGAREWRRG